MKREKFQRFIFWHKVNARGVVVTNHTKRVLDDISNYVKGYINPTGKYKISVDKTGKDTLWIETKATVERRKEKYKVKDYEWVIEEESVWVPDDHIELVEEYEPYEEVFTCGN